jgi:hypothetical protein
VGRRDHHQKPGCDQRGAHREEVEAGMSLGQADLERTEAADPGHAHDRGEGDAGVDHDHVDHVGQPGGPESTDQRDAHEDQGGDQHSRLQGEDPGQERPQDRPAGTRAVVL